MSDRGWGMEEMHEELGGVRRGLRRVEDELAEVNRNKASNESASALAAKISAVESQHRDDFHAIRGGIDELRGNVKRLADAVEALTTDHAKQKRRVADLEEEMPAPAPKKTPEPPPPPPPNPHDHSARGAIPFRMQAALYILAGVGLMAIIQSGPMAAQAALKMWGM